MDRRLKKRFWEIDVLRGIAVILMILYHFVYNLYYLAEYSIKLRAGIWPLLARIISLSFIFLVGISMTLSFSRAKILYPKINFFLKYLKRGLKIFSWGLIVTLITWIFFREKFVIFGILHFIGISIIIAYPFLRLRYWNVLFGSAFIILGLYLRRLAFGFSWLMWLGLRPERLNTFDYFPILPWFGVILFGLFVGNPLYPGYKRKIRLPDLSNIAFIREFCFLGRHSLLVYLLHEPVLIAFMYLLGLI